MSNRDTRPPEPAVRWWALFHNQADAERAIQRLKERGFAESQIGVAIKDRGRQEELIRGPGRRQRKAQLAGPLEVVCWEA